MFEVQEFQVRGWQGYGEGSKFCGYWNVVFFGLFMGSVWWFRAERVDFLGIWVYYNI